MNVYDALSRARAQGRRVVLVTVLAVEGDAPSHAGAKLVAAAGVAAAAPQPRPLPEVESMEVLAGTLGCSEFDAAGVELARQALTEGTPIRRRLEFAEHGRERAIELFAEVHEPEPAVLVFGATPVARALTELVRFLGRRAVLVAPAGDASVAVGVEVKADDPGRYLLAAPPGTCDAVVVTDHDAVWVDEVLRIALASNCAYVGMLGSRRHAPVAVRRLRDAGVPEPHLARLRSPVGLDIGSRGPAEIALSIAAEIVAAERGREGAGMSTDETVGGA